MAMAREKISVSGNSEVASADYKSIHHNKDTSIFIKKDRDTSMSSNSKTSGKLTSPAAVADFVHGGDGGRAAAAKARSAEVVAEEDINAVADAFIRRFREQLQLQRLRSIENYNQMLARGL